MQTNHQMDTFNARVKRIKNPRNTHYQCPETGMQIPKRVSRKVILDNAKVPPPSLVALILAVIVGGLCLMGARYARFSFLDMTQANDTTMMVELALAAIAAFVVGGMIGQKSMRHMAAQAAGVAVMAAAMHNAVWAYPELVAQLAGQEFVDTTLAATVPQSLSLGRLTYSF